MNAILILYAGNLSKTAFEPLFDGKNSVELAIEQAQKFPGAGKIVILTDKKNDFSFLHEKIERIEPQSAAAWTKRSLLEKIAELQGSFDLIYFAFADCPFLDPALAGAIADRQIRYKAEYSYADGWPFGLAPETLSPGTAGILAKISGEDGSVERDILFSVIQKDINAFDIETEISSVDLSCHRLNLQSDSKRNFLLLKKFISANNEIIPAAADIEKIIAEQPEVLRTLPAFYPIQVYGGCPQSCSICPYPAYTDAANRKDFMSAENFEALLDKITAFSGDAVIDLSLWGELSLHPDRIKLIESVLKRKELPLIIETSGIGWKNEELEQIKNYNEQLTKNNEQSRENLLPAISWIVSLDTSNSQQYMKIRGNGFAEAEACAKKLLSLFPNDCYVQAVRFKGSEEDTEKFYRYWKENAPNGEKNIIIQKYDHFCGLLEKKQASDLSPIIRHGCWHIMRDMPVLIDGTVPLCREYLPALKGDKTYTLGNVFSDSLESIWKNGECYYKEETPCGLCADCDEYYTYNF